jgi:hypothetical protein
VILYRCFAWDERAEVDQPDGPLWFPRAYQGEGRHDNPVVYGCLYLSESAVSGVVEQLARFRGNRFVPGMLVRRKLPLAVATIELSDRAEIVDLDDAQTLLGQGLRPSDVATRIRERTQPQALALYRAHGRAAALRWWSIHEASWANLTVFQRASRRLRVRDVLPLTAEDAAFTPAADFLGLT